MTKRYSTFLLQLLFPLFFFGSASVHASAIDSLLIQLPQQTSEKAIGLYISGSEIHIDKNTSISILGDLEMHDATISGAGNVIMKSKSLQKIISSKGTISNLVLQNPKTELHGDLTITEKLTINGSLFDVSNGILKINIENLLVVNGGEIFSGDQPLFTSSNQTAILLSQASSMTIHISEILLLPFLNGYFKSPLHSFQENFHGIAIQELLFQPPRNV